MGTFKGVAASYVTSLLVCLAARDGHCQVEGERASRDAGRANLLFVIKEDWEPKLDSWGAEQGEKIKQAIGRIGPLRAGDPTETYRKADWLSDPQLVDVTVLAWCTAVYPKLDTLPLSGNQVIAVGSWRDRAPKEGTAHVLYFLEGLEDHWALSDVKLPEGLRVWASKNQVSEADMVRFLRKTRFGFREFFYPWEDAVMVVVSYAPGKELLNKELQVALSREEREALFGRYVRAVGRRSRPIPIGDN